MSSISRCVRAHTCLPDLETAWRSAPRPHNQRAALFRRKTLPARTNSQLRQRASHRASHSASHRARNDGRRQEVESLPLPPAPGVVVRRQDPHRVRLPHDVQRRDHEVEVRGLDALFQVLEGQNDRRGLRIGRYESRYQVPSRAREYATQGAEQGDAEEVRGRLGEEGGRG